jgi:hypothetical protein
MKTVKTTTTSRAPRKTRMPDDLTWNTAHSVKAMARHVDVEVEFEKFQNHHLAVGNTFADWDRAFHNWLDRARPEPGPGRVATHRPGPRTPTDRMQEILAIRDPREMGMIE